MKTTHSELNLPVELLEHATETHDIRTAWYVTCNDNTLHKRYIGIGKAIGEHTLEEWLGEIIETSGYPLLVQRWAPPCPVRLKNILLVEVVLDKPDTETIRGLKPGQDLELFQLLHDRVGAVEDQLAVLPYWVVVALALYFVIYRSGWLS